ncbi:MAG: PAS domain S-box protein, partial [Bacteroidetes bacterium]|nr:PAS domain S-box protein [Bacteroidota bacterium]
ICIPTVTGAIIALWLNSRGKTRAAIILVLAVQWAVLTVLGTAFAYFLPPNSNKYLLIVVAAGLILGMRAGIIAAIICGLTETALVYLTKIGVLPAAPGHFSRFGLMLHLLFLAVGAVLPYYATRSIKNALARARKELDERRRAQEALRRSEEHYRNLIDQSPDPIAVHADGKFVYLNRAASDFLCAESPEQLVGSSILEIVHPDFQAGVASLLDELQKPQASAQLLEEKLVRLDGSVKEVEAVNTPTSFYGKPTIQTIIRDVTEQKLIKERMRLQSTALKSAANGIVITERDGTVAWTNPAFELLTGYSVSEAVGNNLLDLVKSGKEKPGLYKELWDSILSGKVWHGETINRRKDGGFYTEYMTITPVRDDRGEITHFVAVKQDITSQKLLEEQLLQSQKLEGIGQLAGGVAHDYNNILNVVIGYSELLKRKARENDPSLQSIEAILAAAKRGAGLTRQLLAFARKEITSPRVINVNSSIDSIREMLQRIVGENLRLVFAPGKDLWNVKMDATQFDQILVNLATNARDAIRDVGTITITTGNVRANEALLLNHPDLDAREYVRMTFQDDGDGMTNEVMQRMFEPFFTTKPKGAGTGLGLSTVYGIVKQNGGAIMVSSEPGAGTVFEIYLRRFIGEADGVAMEMPDEALKGVETVLVVEDQADLLKMVKISLEDYGYNVMTSLDPGEALLLSEAYPGRIHMLLTDLIMPKMNGIELSVRISRLRSGIKTIFMSGYGLNTIAPGAILNEGIEYIQKPFSPRELAGKVREILGS